MSRRTFAVLFFAAILSFPLFGAYTITPAGGSSAGGTEITIHGQFGAGSYELFFGSEKATSVQRIDAQTLRAVTPSHLPGDSALLLFQNDQFVPTNLSFLFTGGVPQAYERLLLPVFIDPVYGQFGSHFITSFTARYVGGTSLNLYGIETWCPLSGCIYRPLIDTPITLTAALPQIDDNSTISQNGNPGRFIYVPRNQMREVAMNLRVYDSSRSDQNYGTEIPIVRESSFTEGYTSLTLLNVPTDPKFRNTLRIYGDGTIGVNVRIEANGVAPIEYDVDLEGGADIFTPSTATLTSFPTNVGLATVTISIPNPPILPPAAPPIWAFITVTNNETQLITTITPQP